MEFTEIIKLALWAVRSNKLRSMLTLLGIAVGVFSIIGVMTAVQVLQNSIETGLSGLGSHTFQIQKEPVLGNRQQWLKAQKRKDIKFEQGMDLKSKMTLAQYVALEVWKGALTVQNGSLKTNPSVSLAGEEPEGIPANDWTIAEGRGLSDNDQQYANKVVVLGDDVMKKVFPNGGAVGSKVRVAGDWYQVIGVFESKGSIFGGDNGNFVVIPLSTFLNEYGKDRSLHVMIKAKSQEVYDDCLEEARFHLRTIRNVPPGAEDDFAIFSNDSLISTFNDFTFYIKIGVGFISFISLLAAGVGIMNIMLVSVTERTKEIGIRKAIGARRSNILWQFIVEAVVLCQVGGMIGIIVGIAIGNMVALLFTVPMVFPWMWAFLGFLITSFVGVVFGVYPAWKAANLDPIEALRYE